MTSKLVLVSLIAMVASSSQALVREMALCHTSDGKYQVSVQDNQGIGPVRTSHLYTYIQDQTGGTVGSFDTEVDTRPHSISFGRFTYEDKKTQGRLFQLSGPSTNFQNYILEAQIEGGKISDHNLDCEIFPGTIQ